MVNESGEELTFMRKKRPRTHKPLKERISASRECHEVSEHENTMEGNCAAGVAS